MLQLLVVASLLWGVVTGLDSVDSSRLQPEVVAHLLSEVEAEWVNDAMKVLENQGDSGEYEKMRKSCSKVSSSVVSASDGEKDRVTEYMTDVCGAMKEDSWLCASFSNRLTSFMSPDASMNRDGSVNLKRFCKVLYGDILSFAKEKTKELEAQRAAEAKLAEERAEEEKKRQEEEHRKEVEEMEVKKMQKIREEEVARKAEAERQYSDLKDQEQTAAVEQAVQEQTAAQQAMQHKEKKLLPKVWEQQPDRFMDRLQEKTQASVKQQIAREKQLQAAYFARQKANAEAQSAPQHQHVYKRNVPVASMGL